MKIKRQINKKDLKKRGKEKREGKVELQCADGFPNRWTPVRGFF